MSHFTEDLSRTARNVDDQVYKHDTMGGACERHTSQNQCWRLLIWRHNDNVTVLDRVLCLLCPLVPPSMVFGLHRPWLLMYSHDPLELSWLEVFWQFSKILDCSFSILFSAFPLEPYPTIMPLHLLDRYANTFTPLLEVISIWIFDESRLYYELDTKNKSRSNMLFTR